jgi:thiamine biosynthesis lipoprotein
MKLLQPRRFHPLKAAWVLLVLALLFVYTTRRDRPPRLWRWAGETMGSSYTVQIVHNGLDERRVAALQADVESVLDELNEELSTWLTNSTLSRFNLSASTDPFPVSPTFADVTALSLELSRLSGGAFDVTFSPMFDLWGFGRTGPKRVPDDASFAQTLALCGYTNLVAEGPDSIRKRIPGLHVVFNALVPGYAAERVSQLLQAQGFTNIYVDVGGETVARGRNLQGQPWRIGIEKPIYDAEPGEELEAVVQLSDRALATSGDYRNYFRDERGQTFSHIFDPRTGRPATSRVASVTVIATNGGWADALATTLFVMGPEQGLPWLTNVPGTEALFVMRESETAFREVASPGFEVQTGYRARE